jgi:hypothetical protein
MGFELEPMDIRVRFDLNLDNSYLLFFSYRQN